MTTTEERTDLHALADAGERTAVPEVQADGSVICRLLRGNFDGRMSGFGAAVETAARAEAERAKAAYAADLADLPSGAEVQRLERVTAGYRAKLEGLTAASAELQERIVSAAAKGELARKDREGLASLTADIAAHKDVLEVAERQLTAARAELAVDRPAVAIRHRTAAIDRIEAKMAEAREAIEGLDAVWSVLTDLAVAANVSRQLNDYFADAIG